MERLTIKAFEKSRSVIDDYDNHSSFNRMRGILMFAFGKDPYVYPSFTEGEPVSIYGAIMPATDPMGYRITGFCIILLFFSLRRQLLEKPCLHVQ